MNTATTATSQPKRTAVRMLQSPCVDGDVAGAAASPRGSAGPGPQPSALSGQASRRRSATFLLPPTEFIDSSNCSGSASTAHAAPAALLPRRVPSLDAVAAANDAAAVSPTFAGSSSAAADSDASPHLSVPLTLLSLHNGGLRHSPRGSRDVSPSPNLLVTREGSICHPGDPDFSPDSAAASDASGAGGGGLFRRGSDRSSVTGSSPPRRTNSWLLRSAPLPTSTAPGAPSPSAASPSFNGASVTGIVAATTPRGCSSPILPASASAGGAGGDAGPPADAPSAAAAAGVGGGGGVTLPPHLCSHRPPTPVCKEDDLLSSMRHMSSPTRRRSRFASAADSQLMAAAAAAIAAEEAGLLDSPLSAAGGGGGGGGSGSGNWSYNGMATEPRSGRRTVALGSFGSDTGSVGNGSFVVVPGAGSGGGGPGIESPLSRSGLAAGEHSPRMSNLSMSWRSSQQLVTVPEERPQSRSDGRPSSGPAGPSAAVAAVAGAADAPPPQVPPLVPRGPSFANAGSFPRAATPGPGLVVVGPGGVLGRRLRNSSSNSSSSNNLESALALARDSAGSDDSAAVSTTDGGGGPPDDALSSFMHSFGPPPGTPSAERRCPVATPADVSGSGVSVSGSLGLGLGLGVPVGGRITAR